MKLFLFLITTCVPISCFGRVSSEFIGCFKDRPTRAIPVLLETTADLKESCKVEAAYRGYKVYGIQNQGQCWSGPDAENTYNKYGPTDVCSNGLGGPWANSVYRVESDSSELAGILSDAIANAQSIDDVDVGAFIDSSSKLLNLSNDEWKKNPKIADNFLNASEGLLSLGMDASTSKTSSSNLMVFSVSKVDTRNKASLVFPNYTEPAFSSQQSRSSFLVPTINNTDSANIGGYVYSNLHEKLTTLLDATDLMYKSHLTQTIISDVLSCQVNPPILFGINTNETILVTLEHNKPLSDNAIAICGFWKHAESNESSGVWSTEGCNVIFSNSTHTQCNCTHLTNFAILMQYKEVEIDDDHERALRILTNIGCSLSLVSIFMTVAIYLVFRLYRAVNFHIHTNLCFAIALAQIFLLCLSQAKDDEVSCKIMSAFLHYFCLCVFTWMLVEGMQIYKKVVSIFSSSLNLIYCHLIGWGSPIFIVAITYASREDHYTDLNTCWLSPNYGIRWAFIGPVLTIITINIIVTIVTLHKRLQLRSLSTKEMTYKLRTSLRAFFVLLPIFGITWIVGICGFSSKTIAAMYIFVVLNASQGVLIFLFHCLLNAEVRKTVLQGRHMRIHTRNGTLSGGHNKQQLQKTTSKNSDCSTKPGSGQSSNRSVKDFAFKEEERLTNNTATSPRKIYLEP